MQANTSESHRYAVRLALFYAALFAGFGIYMPFFPVWLKSIGLGDGQIGLMLAAVTLTRITVTPLAMRMADRRTSLKPMIVACSLGATLILPLLALPQPFWTMLPVLVACCIFWGPLTPLSDAYAMGGIARRGLDYGKIRAWGSIAFLVAALLGGLIKPQIAEVQLIWVQWGALSLTVVASVLLLADHRVADTPSSAFRPRPRFVNGRFIAVLAVAAIIQGSHGLQYGFSSIHWATLGFSAFAIGLLWALGVFSEILLFLVGRRFVERFDPLSLMAYGAFAGVLRWCITSFDPPLWLQAPLQLLHAGSFGIVHLATIAYLSQSVPERARARGLGFSTVAVGGGQAVMTVIAGALYARMSGHAYWVMAALALVGMIAALVLRDRLQPHRDGAGGNTVEPS